MKKNTPFLTWDLKQIVFDIIKRHPEILEIYLFGSRSYKTHSYRSDIDILAITDNIPLSDAEINSWLHEKYPPVDLFCSYDSKVAKSIINGRYTQYFKDNRWGYGCLIEQLDTKLLWNNQKGFSSDFADWIQKTLNGVDYKMSVIPSYPIPDFSETVSRALYSLEASGIKTFYGGSTWIEISKNIIKLIEVGVKNLNVSKKSHLFFI